MAPPKTAATRKSKDKAKAKAAEATFTYFPKLPAEIRDMIWDEALFEFSLIQIGSWSIHDSLNTRIPHNVGREGLNPANVALSCREAADRWRKHFPRCKLVRDVMTSPSDNDTSELKLSMRCNLDRTIFLADSSFRLHVFLRNANCVGSYNVAFRVKRFGHDSSNTGRNYSNLGVQNVLMDVHQIDGVKRWHAINRLFKVSKDAGRTLSSIAKGLSQMMQRPDESDKALICPSTKREWLREMDAEELSDYYVLPQCP